MDTTKLDALERCIQRLLVALAHAKAENARLTQDLTALQQAFQAQQHSRASWDAAQAELHDLRGMTQHLQHERNVMRTTLEAILATVEHLEGLTVAAGTS